MSRQLAAPVIATLMVLLVSILSFLTYAEAGSLLLQADLSITKSSDEVIVAPGDQFSYILTVTNDGPDVADKVFVNDFLPDDVTFVSVNNANCMYDAASHAVLCEIPNVMVDEVIVIVITVQVKDGTPNGTIIENEADTFPESSTTEDPDPDDNTGSTTGPLVEVPVGQADLEIKKVASVNELQPGESFFYTITVKNNGSNDLIDVEVIDFLIGAMITSIDPDGFVCTTVGNMITCTLDVLPAGEQKQITVNVQVDIAFDGNGIVNLVEAKALNGDPASDTIIVPVKRSADLSIDKKADKSPVLVGSEFTYTLTVKNNGLNTATGVTLTDAIVLATFMTIDDVTSPDVFCDISTTGLGFTCNIGTMLPGQTIEITVTISVAEDTPHGTVLVNTAEVTSDTEDLKPGNNKKTVEGPTVERPQFKGLWAKSSEWTVESADSFIIKYCFVDPPAGSEHPSKAWTAAEKAVAENAIFEWDEALDNIELEEGINENDCDFTLRWEDDSLFKDWVFGPNLNNALGICNIAPDANGSPDIVPKSDFPGLEIYVNETPNLPWFIDPTPFFDTEFNIPAGQTFGPSVSGGPAAGKYDLRTHVLHEVGHCIGLPHTEAGPDNHLGTDDDDKDIKDNGDVMWGGGVSKERRHLPVQEEDTTALNERRHLGPGDLFAIDVMYLEQSQQDPDGDGIPSTDDNCMNAFNPAQTDSDQDGNGDACDLDEDNDYWADFEDNCVGVSNITQKDSDGDGIGDACDPDAIPIVELTVRSEDDARRTITGYFTVLSQTGVVLETGFTPASFMLNSGETYTIEAQDFENIVFKEWKLTGSTDNERDIAIITNTEIIAVYRDILNHPRGTSLITIHSLHGSTEIIGYFTVLSQNGVVLETSFTPAILTVNDGETYNVGVEDFGDFEFWRWQDTGSNIANRDFAISSDRDFYAEYRRMTDPSPQGTSKLTVRTVNSSGDEIFGYWTVLVQGGAVHDIGFSPTNFLLNNDVDYEIFMGDWAGVNFDHFEDGSTNIPYPISINGNTEIIVHYSETSTPSFLDLAVVNLDSDNVSVLLGDGTGSFGTATNFGTDSRPISVAVGDFNGDTKLDLAVANSFSSNNVSILLGDGTGSFGAATNFAAGFNPFFIAVGDFNGDTKLDLAVANSSGTGSISVLLGDGTGSFGAPTQFVLGTRPSSVTVGDFNGDTKLDLVVANLDSPR